MNFFKPEDFKLSNLHGEVDFIYKKVSDIANAKLEKEGKVVYGKQSQQDVWSSTRMPSDFLKAIIINVEPIEKCKHPKDKVKEKKVEFHGGPVMGEQKHMWTHLTYECECGADVKPSSFEGIND